MLIDYATITHSASSLSAMGTRVTPNELLYVASRHNQLVWVFGSESDKRNERKQIRDMKHHQVLSKWFSTQSKFSVGMEGAKPPALSWIPDPVDNSAERIAVAKAASSVFVVD